MRAFTAMLDRREIISSTLHGAAAAGTGGMYIMIRIDHRVLTIDYSKFVCHYIAHLARE